MRASILIVTTACWMMLASAAQATLIYDDFSYASGTLKTNAGGGGWSTSPTLGQWGRSAGATTAIGVSNTTNLSYSAGGYSISQTGTGIVINTLSAGGLDRGINRDVTSSLVSNPVIWFSILMENSNNGTGTNNAYSGIQFNWAPATDYNEPASYRVALDATSLDVIYNGTATNGVATLPLGSVHLLLGRITFQDNGVNDKLDVWADPANLSALGSPLFTNNTANMGATLTQLGLYSNQFINVRPGVFDALRASDGNGSASVAFQDVTGVPEPMTLSLLVAGGGLAILRRKR